MLLNLKFRKHNFCNTLIFNYYIKITFSGIFRIKLWDASKIYKFNNDVTGSIVVSSFLEIISSDNSGN